MLVGRSITVGLAGGGTLVLLLAKVPATGLQQGKQHPIPSVDGAEMFRAHCAVCHGTNATGNGPAASALKTRPPDLSMIAQRNGGKFPRERIREVIAGNDEMTAHG